MAFNFLRILTSILLLFSILFMPFWISVILALGAMIYFAIFWEATILFLFSDLLYGIKETKNSPEVFTSFIISLIILVIIKIFKKKLKFYN